jgi:hypothetical protein
MRTSASKRPGRRGVSPPARAAARGSTALRAWLLAAASGLVYLTVAGAFRFDFRQTDFAHHILMADALLHGQLHIRDEALRAIVARGQHLAENILEVNRRETGQVLTSEQRQAWIEDWVRTRTLQDWTLVDGRYYGYWAPLLPVAMIPYVAIVGLGASDTLIDALVGTLNVGLFYWLLRRLDGTGLCPMTEACCVLLTLLLAFGTVHFYLACAGSSWFAAQTITLAALLAAMISACGPDPRLRDSALAGAFFGAAILGRNIIALVAGFFIILCWLRTAGLPRRRASFLRHVLAFALPCVVAVMLQAAYNRARFGSVFEDGLAIQIRTTGNAKFRDDYERYGLFDRHYLLRNAKYYLWNANLPRDSHGRVTYDPEGNSMLLVTPPLAFMLLAWRRRAVFTWALLGGIVPFLTALLLYLATGYQQFGNRYLLEIMPLMLLLAATGMRGRVTLVSYVLVVLAIAVNLFGTYRFCALRFAPVAPYVGTWTLPAFVVIFLIIGGLVACWPAYGAPPRRPVR